MINKITSSSNNLFKHVKSLEMRKHREKNREFIAEGLRLVKEAVNSIVKLKYVIVNEEFINCENNAKLLETIDRNSIDIYEFTPSLFKKVIHTETSQGILGVISYRDYDLKEIIFKNEFPFYILCDRLQDPGNMGSIIRTADAAGADAVILSKGCVDIYNPKTVRSTMGSLFHIPIIKNIDIESILGFLKENKLNIVTGHLSASKYYFDIDMKKGIVIVLGNEGSGVCDKVVSFSDYLVKIPLIGAAESLNVSTACAVLAYEVVRQRMSK